jgi:6-phosphofructokinase
MSQRVAILTGGEVPGMNLCIKSLVYRLIDLGFEPIGVRKGWEGLINYNPRDPSTYEVFLQPLTYLVRTDEPDGQDLLGATNFAMLAARLVKEGKTMLMVTHDKKLARQVLRVVEIIDDKITRDEYVGGAEWAGY